MNRKWSNRLLALFAALCLLSCSAGIRYVLHAQQLGTPVNPMEERKEEDENLYVSAMVSYLPTAEETLQEAEESAEEETSEESENLDEDTAGDAENPDASTVNDEMDPGDSDSGKSKPGSGKKGNSDGGDKKGGGGKKPGDSSDPVKKDLKIYTDLQDESMTNQKEFSFQAYAREDGEEAALTVTVNGSGLEGPGDDHTWQTVLSKGTNEIRLRAEGKSGETREAVYHIVYATTNASILTDLKDQQVDQPEFEFTAKVIRADNEEISPVVVRLNGAVVESSDFNYHVTLPEGINEITLDARSVSEDLEVQSYNIIYSPEIRAGEKLISTDLADLEVTEAAFNFFAEASQGGNPIDLTATMNGTEIYANASGYYFVNLSPGDNVFVLSTGSQADDVTQSYTVVYTPPVEPTQGGEEDPGGPEADKTPVIETNISDGYRFNGDRLLLKIWATDYLGNPLSSEQIQIRVNMRNKNWTLLKDGTRDGGRDAVSYRLSDLPDGANVIKITVMDSEYNRAEAELTVESIFVEPGGQMGTAALTVSGADSMTFDMPILAGKTAGECVFACLQENGYIITGSAGFIEGLNHPRWAALGYPDGMSNHGDIGWIYQLNGVYPNVGLGGWYPEDGDRIVLLMGKADHLVDIDR